MAIRVSISDVQCLLGLDSDTGVYPYMQAANRLVDGQLASKGLSQSLLEQIELMLSAHFYRLAHPEISRESYGDADFAYRAGTSRNATGFETTSWGQMAVNLDTSGTLKQAGKTRASLTAL